MQQPQVRDTMRESLPREETWRPAQALSAAELIQEIGGELGSLARKQMELARTEIASDLKSEALMAGGLGIAALLGFIAVIMLLMTAVLALGRIMPDWLAGLIVSGVLLLTGAAFGALGWSRRVTNPLVRTREQLHSDFELTQKK